MDINYQDYKAYSFKGTPQVYFDFFYRKISHPVSFLLLKLNLTPNHISVSSIFLSIVGGLIIIFGFPIYGLIVFMLSYLLDFCDGNVARVFIKTVGLSEISKNKGGLIENTNTNISLLMMHLSIGLYLTNTSGQIIFLIIGFLTFGIKMINRYALLHAYPLFKDHFSSLSKGEEIMNGYKKSLFFKIKFLFNKCLFSANFYYVTYFLVFLLLGGFVVPFFIFYASLDIFYSLFRLLRLFIRKYT